MNAFKPLISATLSLSLLLVAPTGYASQAPTNKQSLSHMLDHVLPGVVNIAISKIVPAQRPKPGQKPTGPRRAHGVGSGVIVDAKHGLIVTNAHVVNGASSMVVTLNDSRRFIGHLVGIDPRTDLAVIRIPTKNLVSVPIADSDTLKVGDFVTTIGSPFGLNQTVTSGVVSGLHRHIGLDGIENFIQTDAPINPGNSGGALIDANGELVGINSAILSLAGGNMGIGFAIPVNMASHIVRQLVKYGNVKRGQLGVIIQDLTPRIATALGMTGSKGAILNAVLPGSSAATAGLETGDVVTNINGKTIRSAAQIKSLIGVVRIGTKLIFTIHRGKLTLEKEVITALPKKPDEKDQAKDLENQPLLKGLELRDFDRYSGEEQKRIIGVQVTDVVEGSRAWLSSLMPGDIIVEAAHQKANTLSELLPIAKKAQTQDELLLKVRRGANILFLVIN